MPNLLFWSDLSDNTTCIVSKRFSFYVSRCGCTRQGTVCTSALNSQFRPNPKPWMHFLFHLSALSHLQSCFHSSISTECCTRHTPAGHASHELSNHGMTSYLTVVTLSFWPVYWIIKSIRNFRAFPSLFLTDTRRKSKLQRFKDLCERISKCFKNIRVFSFLFSPWCPVLGFGTACDNVQWGQVRCDHTEFTDI